MLDPLADAHGYHFKDSPLVLHDQAFADDLSILSSCPSLNQATIDVVERFLEWAFLKAKPSKCVCMAMKRFEPNSVVEKLKDVVYSPFDPDLKIAGEKIRFIVNIAIDPASLHYDHFKELGRFISVDLKEDKIKSEVRKRFLDDMEKVESSGVNGLCKLFLYQHFVLTRLSWAFLVHDFCLTFAHELEEIATKRLKAWSGLYRSADIGTLYRKREHLGLQLTNISSHYKHMQVTKSCLLSTSQDPRIQEIFLRKQTRVNTFSRIWSGPKTLTELKPVLEHSLRFAGQTDRTGLGSGNYVAKPSLPEIRAKMAGVLGALEEEKRVNHSPRLAQQGVDALG